MIMSGVGIGWSLWLVATAIAAGNNQSCQTNYCLNQSTLASHTTSPLLTITLAFCAVAKR